MCPTSLNTEPFKRVRTPQSDSADDGEEKETCAPGEGGVSAGAAEAREAFAAGAAEETEAGTETAR